jgi:hypothetical protein
MQNCTCVSHEGISGIGGALEVDIHSLLTLSLKGGDGQLHAPAVRVFYINLTSMGPCNLIIFQYISNKMQRYTVYFIWKLLYMFRVIPSPIIRSANNGIYSVCYLSHSYCYPPLAAGSSNCVTNTRWCRYSGLRSWWRVMVSPEICTAVSR